MTILIEIAFTARPYGRNQEWFRYADKTHRFDTVPDAMDWVRENYPRRRNRKPVYSDTMSRGTIQTGWVISGRDDCSKNFTQDWVTLREVTSETKREAIPVDVSKLCFARRGGNHVQR